MRNMRCISSDEIGQSDLGTVGHQVAFSSGLRKRAGVHEGQIDHLFVLLPFVFHVREGL